MVRAMKRLLLFNIVISVFPFIIRTLMLRFLGKSYIGLTGVYGSIVSMMNIMEMGFASVIVYYLYRPASEEDIPLVNALLGEIRKVYLVIALCMSVITVIVIPFLDIFVGGDATDIQGNIRILFLCYSSSVILQYILWPEVTSILTAYQRVDWEYCISLIGHIVAYVLQIIAIVVFRSYTGYILAILLQTFLTALLHLRVRKRYFPSVYPCGKLDVEKKKEIKRDVASVFGQQLDEKMLECVDNLFISTLFGLVAVAHYGNYFYVVSAVSMLLNTVYGSITAGIGNAMAVEPAEENYTRYKATLFLSGLMGGWAGSCMLVAYQTFMRIWMPGSLLPFEIVLLMTIYAFIVQIRQTTKVFKNAAGLWQRDKLRPYVAVVADLILDAILIKTCGVKGAILATVICAGFIELPWEAMVLFKEYFHKRLSEYLLIIVKYVMATVILWSASYYIANRFVSEYGLFALACRIVLASVVSFIYFLIIYCRNDEMRLWKITIRQALKTIR